MYHIRDHPYLKQYTKSPFNNFQHTLLAVCLFFSLSSIMGVNMLYVIIDNYYYLTSLFLLYPMTELKFDEYTHTHFGKQSCSSISIQGNHFIFSLCSYNIFRYWALILLLCSLITYLAVSPCPSHSYAWHGQYLNIYSYNIKPVLGTWEVLNIYILDK